MRNIPSMKVRCRPPGCVRWVLGLFVAAVVGGGVWAADAGTGSAPQGEDPLDAFVRRLDPKERLRVAPIIEAAAADKQVRRYALQEALLALNPELAGALNALNAEQAADALPILEKLAGSSDPFLATHAVWLQVRALTGLERYEDALKALKSVQAKAAPYTLVADDMLYTEGRLQACLLDRPAAAVLLQRYLDQYPNAPAERRGAAQELLEEIIQFKPASLSEAAALMDDARRRLRLSDTGDLTQARLQQIAGVLGQVIEVVEEKPTKGGGANGPGGGGKEEGNKTGKKPGKGAEESKLRASAAEEVHLAQPPEGGQPDDWAKAYARDRERVQQELQTRLPERYRDLIEQYYRSLSGEGMTDEEDRK